MGAKLKLQRRGAKNRPFYRVVVQDESAARDGRVIEVLGQYNPLVEPSFFEVDREKILAWLDRGAQPTEKLRILLGKAGVLPPVDLAALPKRKPRAEAPPGRPVEEVKTEEKKEEEKPASASAGKPTTETSSSKEEQS